MTPSDWTDGDESFEVSASDDTVAVSAEYEGANVCRVAALSTRFGDDEAAFMPLAPEFAELGFSGQITSPERRWGERDLQQDFADLGGVQGEEGSYRIRSWQRLNESGRAQDAFLFLVSVLGSPLERESAAAAAALWRQLGPALDPSTWRGPRLWRFWDRLDGLWDGAPSIAPGWPWQWPGPGTDGSGQLGEVESTPWNAESWLAVFQRAMSRLGDSYTDPLLVALLVRWRLAQAVRSADPITVSLAMAAFEPSGAGDAEEAQPPRRGPQIPPGSLVVSTMIHGTWGWKGDWWRPTSGFHEFILRNHRPNLYARGAKYSWSGALSDKQRVQAASDFCDWAYDVAPNGLQTVFGHSYGGEVAARAVLGGARISELVLLSVPVTAWVERAVPWTPRVVDVRLRFDPVLALAQTRQRITDSAGNLTTVLLERWRFDHGATHEEPVWRSEDVARRGQL
jgi:hypothetical protein